MVESRAELGGEAVVHGFLAGSEGERGTIHQDRELEERRTDLGVDGGEGNDFPQRSSTV